MVLFTGVSMETSGWKSVYRASGTGSRLVLTIVLFTAWEWPSHGAPLSEPPPPTQTEATLDLSSELSSPESSSAKPSSSGAPHSETTLFDEIPSVYGAAKYDQKVHEAPAAVTIITAEQIRKYGYRSFAQILDSVPGLFTSTDRNYGYLGIRGFNRSGDYTSRVLLLINNHRLNDAIVLLMEPVRA
jgi:outer membrane receptor protein involved in Fe transport